MNKFHCTACKYEYEEDWVDGKRTSITGDNPPKQILLSNSIRFQIYNPEPFEDIVLWACPKCNTVKIEI